MDSSFRPCVSFINAPSADIRRFRKITIRSFLAQRDCELLTRLSGRLVFSVRFIQDVGAASHPEVVVDPPEPPVRDKEGQLCGSLKLKKVCLKKNVVLALHRLKRKKVPHQCCVAGERTKFDFFEGWLESQNVQSLLLRNRWQAGDAH